MDKYTDTTTTYMVLSPTEDRVLRFVEAQATGVSVSDISRGVHLARSSIYNATRSLEQKRLLKRDGFKYRTARSPELLKKYSVLNTTTKIQEVLLEVLALKKGEVVYSIESDEEISELLELESGLPKWQKAIAEKGIVLKDIGSIEALSQFQRNISDSVNNAVKKRSDASRFSTDVLKGPGVLLIFKDSVVLFSRKQKYFYRIDDTFVARFTKNVLELLYSLLEYRPVV